MKNMLSMLRKSKVFLILPTLFLINGLVLSASAASIRNDKGIRTWNTNYNGSYVTASTGWSYDIGYSGSSALAETETYVDGRRVGKTTAPRSNAYSATATLNNIPVSGSTAETSHYGHTSYSDMTVWGARSSYGYGYSSKSQNAMVNFTSNILSDFGYSSSDLTAYRATDNDLRDEIAKYVLFEMQRNDGDTIPIIYENSSKSKYYVVYQDANGTNYIYTLTLENMTNENVKSATETNISVNMVSRPGPVTDLATEYYGSK